MTPEEVDSLWNSICEYCINLNVFTPIGIWVDSTTDEPRHYSVVNKKEGNYKALICWKNEPYEDNKLIHDNLKRQLDDKYVVYKCTTKESHEYISSYKALLDQQKLTFEPMDFNNPWLYKDCYLIDKKSC